MASSPRRLTSLAATSLATMWIVSHADPSSAWVRTLEPSVLGDSGTSVAADGAGDVLAGGHAGGRFTVVKHAAASGAELWRREIQGTGAAFDNVVGALAVDGAGHAVAAGMLNNSGQGSDFVVIKLDGATGAEIWRQEIDGGAGFGDIARDVAVTGTGDVVAAGLLQRPVTGAAFTIVKFDGASGTELWRQEIDGSGSDTDTEAAYAVSVDAGGNVVAAGFLSNASSRTDFTVVKLDGATGAELWRQEIDGSAASADDDAAALSIDAAGDVLAAGRIETASLSGAFAVVKLDGASGAELWRQEIATGRASALDTDAAGDVLAAGQLVGASTTVDFAVLKLDGSTGAELWRREFDGLSLGHIGATDDADALRVDATGDVLASGHAGPSLLLKLDGDTGADLWRTETATNKALAVDAAGDVVTSGSRAVAPVGGFTVSRLDGDTGSAGSLSGRLITFQDLGSPTSRRIRVIARDANTTGATAGTPGDPSLGGATVRIVNPSTSEEATFVLPGGTRWKALGNPPGRGGYKYRDPSGADTCRSVLVRPGKLVKILCSGKNGGAFPFTLDEASQGSLAVSVQLGSYVPQCTVFGGLITRDEPGLFIAKNAPADQDCP